jgi:hypothetical protein
MASDSSVTGTGVNVDGVQIFSSFNCSPVTAADVTVSGRVLTSDGRGLTNARVSLTNEAGVTRTVITGRRGTFAFEKVESGQTYIISVGSRRFEYTPQVLEIDDNIEGLIFTPSQ